MTLEQLMLRALPDAANDDAEFAIAARMWDADVVFASDGNAVKMSIADGRITDIASVPRASTAEICISGPEDGWTKMLAPLPAPFYQDLFGASIHHGFTIEGEVEAVYPYYPALRRLIELLRVEAAR
jgi:hypothetical protein